MSRSWILFLEDMREAAAKILRYAGDRDKDSFFADEMAFDATIRNLFILGEAAKGIPTDVRARHSEVDWRRIAGLRDVLAHAYFGLDDDAIWDTIQNKIPPLIEQLDHIAESSA